MTIFSCTCINIHVHVHTCMYVLSVSIKAGTKVAKQHLSFVSKNEQIFEGSHVFLSVLLNLH